MKEENSTFFVDYENVGKDGLNGLSALDSSDCVFVFYSNACPKLPMQSLHDNSAKLCSVEVAPGKQALDIQLSTYFGHMIQNDMNRYYIVSNDFDFDKIVDFWKKRGVCGISRISSIKDATLKKECINSSAVKVTPLEDPEIRSWIGDIISRYANDTDRKSRIHGELSRRFGQTDGRKIYMQIKETIA